MGRLKRAVGLLGVLCVFLSLAAGAVEAKGSRKGKAGCGAPRSKTLLATSQLRVYRTSVLKTHGVRKSSVFACWSASRRRTLLDREYFDPNLGEESLKAVRLAPASREIIAAKVHSEGGTSSDDILKSVDVRTGATLQSNDRGSDLSTVNDFIVTTSGSLAWIGSDDRLACGVDGVISIDPMGLKLQQCASGADPKRPATLSQLAWADGTLSWLSDGQAMSAPLS